FDERAKINPNLASDVLLTALFEAAGMDRLSARHLGSAIADWVGPDAASRPFGAKLREYAAAGRSHGPPNAPIESLDELQLVLGMTPDSFRTVRPYLTIYTELKEPDANASPIVRRAVRLAARDNAHADQAVPDMNSPMGAAEPSGETSTPQAQVLDLEITAHSA